MTFHLFIGHRNGKAEGSLKGLKVMGSPFINCPNLRVGLLSGHVSGTSYLALCLLLYVHREE